MINFGSICDFEMKSLLSTERSQWVFVILLLAITYGYVYKVLYHYSGDHYKPQEISHNYESHDCKGSKDFGCRG